VWQVEERGDGDEKKATLVEGYSREEKNVTEHYKETRAARSRTLEKTVKRPNPLVPLVPNCGEKIGGTSPDTSKPIQQRNLPTGARPDGSRSCSSEKRGQRQIGFKRRLGPTTRNKEESRTALGGRNWDVERQTNRRVTKTLGGVDA